MIGVVDCRTRCYAIIKDRQVTQAVSFLKLTARVFKKWSKIIPVCGIIVVKRKITAELAVIFHLGGPEEIRTPDPYNANVMRSQLRYRPKFPKWLSGIWAQFSILRIENC